MRRASLDPGVWKMGLAISVDGVITEAHAVRVDRCLLWSFAAAINAVVDAAKLDLDPQRARDLTWHGALPSHWTIENPQVYPSVGKVGSAADVKKLEDLAGNLARDLRSFSCKTKLVRPNAWKANVPKRTHHRRIRKYLTPEELVIFDVDYGDAVLDVRDAVALELFALGRVGRGGTRRHRR